MLWGSEQLYDMHIGGGNKTLLVDMHKRPRVTRANLMAYYMYMYSIVWAYLYKIGLMCHIAHMINHI